MTVRLAVGWVKKPVGQASLVSAVKSSGAVSPATRATASRTPVMSPLFAERKTTARVMRQRGAPIASADSRSAFGTMHSMSSVVRRMTGNMMIARATEPAKPENRPVVMTISV